MTDGQYLRTALVWWWRQPRTTLTCLLFGHLGLRWDGRCRRRRCRRRGRGKARRAA